MPVLNEISGKSKDVLKVQHRSSEPFDIALNPANLAVVTFKAGHVAMLDASGFAVPSKAATLDAGTAVKLGLFVMPRNPNDTAKNDYVEASGNASIFTSGIVILDDTISISAVAVGAKLYATDLGNITTVAPVKPANAYIGIAMTARTALGQPVRVKLEM